MGSQHKLMEQLCETFDVSFYDKLPVLYKSVLSDNIDHLRQTYKSRSSQALLTILYNHLFPKEITCKYLFGPVSVTQLYSRYYDKNIYLFGDIHNLPNEKCMEKDGAMAIQNFLYDTIKYSDKYIDFFMEDPYRKIAKPYEEKDFIGSDVFISLIRKKFRLCGATDKDFCPLPNLRYHYSDVRDELENYLEVLFVIDKFMYFYEKGDDQRIKEAMDEDPRLGISVKNKFGEYTQANLLKFIKNKLEELYIYINKPYKDVIDHLLIKSKIDKQFKNVPDKNILSVMKKFKNKIYNLFSNDEWKIFQKTIKYSIDYFPNRKIYDSEYINIIFEEVLVPLFDIYVLGRMFRNYSKETGNQYSQPAKNIIIFAGCLHTKNIENILLALKFDIIFKTGFCDEDDEFVSKCVNVSKLKQPLFKI
jgi:hypothetical protein